MTQEQPNNPLHGVTLEAILNQLVAHYGWAELGRQIDIRCFNYVGARLNLTTCAR
ncbi:VF530 family DNA-binding protein [Dechloromonas sp. ARDL1]|uniref:VF530 family DNA-binding protein n=1 Tax=Dechloromonas sp. ARDL1 TaxID=3322121 RepID=UPI003DA7120C